MDVNHYNDNGCENDVDDDDDCDHENDNHNGCETWWWRSIIVDCYGYYPVTNDDDAHHGNDDSGVGDNSFSVDEDD